MYLKNRKPFDNARLSRMQLYIGEEMVEKYQANLITWQQMLRSLVLIGGSAAAAAAILVLSGADLPSPPPGGSQIPQIVIQPPTGPLVVPEDNTEVQGQMLSFESDRSLKGYLTRPASPGQYPGIIVIHEANGLSDHIKDVSRRLAKAGFIAFAPDLLSRWGITPEIPFEKIFGLLGNAQPEQLLTDLNAAVDFLTQQSGVTGKLGVVGFCFGGGYTLSLAAANPKINAAVCYYGVTPQPASRMVNTQAAVLSHYGAKDQRVNATVPELEQVMAENGKTFEHYYYEGAGHGFNNDTVATFFNQEAAVMAWQRTLDWFNRYLK
ncbi:MAG TPA: dienelactone hydrolase family protein [Chloroflexia bacterium]|nr:dienelactone hydrolase family protein [Chloroflexia bacterium]